MTSTSDTIVARDHVLEAFRQSRNYDYAQELTPDHKENYFDRLQQWLDDALNLNLSLGRIPDWVWWGLLALVLMGVFFLLWKHRESLFSPRDKDQDRDFTPLEITEDDINEIDFEQLIAEAEKDGDYLMLCRLRYLQTLKAASDASLVVWQRSKTPTQYAMEWKDDDFGFMTNHFLRIRYGHYGADAALAREMHSRQQAVMSRIGGQETAGRQPQEGGEQS